VVGFNTFHGVIGHKSGNQPMLKWLEAVEGPCLCVKLSFGLNHH